MVTSFQRELSTPCRALWTLPCWCEQNVLVGSPCTRRCATMFALTSLGGCLASTAAACACSCCTRATSEALKQSARLGTCVLFTFSMILAWILRDFAKPLLQKIPCEPEPPPPRGPPAPAGL